MQKNGFSHDVAHMESVVSTIFVWAVPACPVAECLRLLVFSTLDRLIISGGRVIFLGSAMFAPHQIIGSAQNE